MPNSDRYCTFGIGSLKLALCVDCLVEVLDDVELTRVPLALPPVVGLMNLRGQVVTAVDFRSDLLPEGEEPDPLALAMVVELEENEVAIMVDSVGDVTPPESVTLQPVPPTISGRLRELADHVFQFEDQAVVVLSSKRISRTVES